MGSNKTRGLSQSTHEKSPGRRLHVIYVREADFRDRDVFDTSFLIVTSVD